MVCNKPSPRDSNFCGNCGHMICPHCGSGRVRKIEDGFAECFNCDEAEDGFFLVPESIIKVETK